MQKYLFFALGGALGSMARYWVGSTISGRTGVRFPYGTLIVNITACVLLGFVSTMLGKRADLDPEWRMFIAVGCVGAYSTFSTFQWETFSIVRSGAVPIGALYAFASLILGLVATWGGALLAGAVS